MSAVNVSQDGPFTMVEGRKSYAYHYHTITIWD